MEFVLLWLDDLDDLIFAAAVSWRGTCRLGLSVGFPAALLLTSLYRTDLHMHWTIALSIIAAGSVVAWLSAALPVVSRPLRSALATA